MKNIFGISALLFSLIGWISHNWLFGIISLVLAVGFAIPALQSKEKKIYPIIALVLALLPIVLPTLTLIWWNIIGRAM